MGGAKPVIHATWRCQQTRTRLPVLWQARPARLRDLQEYELPAKFRTRFEQSLDCQELLVQSLGVVKPIDADDQRYTVGQFQTVTDSTTADLDGGRLSRPSARPLN